MIPTSNNLHWGRHWSPNVDYSFKHSFSWPHPPDPAKLAEAASTNAANAAEGAAAHLAHGPHGVGGMPPRGPGMQYHMYGRGGYPFVPRRRFGRFAWFALGVGATALYFRHKERHRELERAIASGEITPKRSAGWDWRCENTRSTTTSPPMTTPSVVPYQQYQPPSPTSGIELPSSTNYDQQKISRPTESAILTALQQQPLGLEPAAQPVVEQKQDHHWRWAGRRRRQEAREAETAQAQEERQREDKTAGPTVAREAGQEEMKRLREVVESLWNDRQVVAATAQAQANEKAKEYAREKLEKLTVVLESLKESLKQDNENKPKLV